MAGTDLNFGRGGRILALAALALAAGGCTPLDNFLASIPIFGFMRESPAFDPYEAPRNAPAGSVPFASPLGAPPLPPTQPTDAGLRAFAATVTNPFPISEAVLEAGKAAYDTHCYVCHGPQGRGDGPVIGPGRFPFAPSLLTANATGYPDGYIYGIIRVGRGLMPAYGGRISHRERWYIVNYVRHLQQTQGAAPARSAAPAAGATQGRE